MQIMKLRTGPMDGSSTGIVTSKYRHKRVTNSCVCASILQGGSASVKDCSISVTVESSLSLNHMGAVLGYFSLIEHSLQLEQRKKYKTNNFE